MFDLWVWKIPQRRAWKLTPVFLPGESHEQWSLEGYSAYGCKESDTTEATQHPHMHYSDWVRSPLLQEVRHEKHSWFSLLSNRLQVGDELLYECEQMALSGGNGIQRTQYSVILKLNFHQIKDSHKDHLTLSQNQDWPVTGLRIVSLGGIAYWGCLQLFCSADEWTRHELPSSSLLPSAGQGLATMKKSSAKA